MQSQTNCVTIKTESTHASRMKFCLQELISRFNITEIDSISCDRDLKVFKVHFTDEKDSKRFENGLRFENGQLVVDSPLKEMGKSKRNKQADENIKERPRVRSSTRSSDETPVEADPSSETTPRQAAKRNRDDAMPNSKTKKQKTVQDDASGINKPRTMKDYFEINNKAESKDSEEKPRSPASSASDVTPGPSHETPSDEQNAGVIKSLSKWFQKDIEEVCASEQAVLNVDSLDALLINVKKKTKLIPILLNYTNKLDDLKGQLLAIKKTFYNRKTKDEAKREDKKFIDWLQVFLERFEKQLKIHHKNKTT